VSAWRRAPFLALGAAAILGLASPRRADGQGVIVAPPVVVIDHRTRGGSLELYNSSRTPVEVAIALEYGYPVTDSLGAIGLATFDTAAPGEPTAAPWIDIYPKRVTVPPGQRQTVRFLARPPADLADREYWSRIIISSKLGAIPVTTADTTSGISASLNLTVNTITTLLYRKGMMQTSLAISGLTTTVTPDSLTVRTMMTPSGNAAWLGTIRGSLENAQGSVVAGFERPIGIYHPIDPAFTLSRAGVPPGTYTLVLEGQTDRADLPRSSLVQAPTVRAQIEVTIATVAAPSRP